MEYWAHSNDVNSAWTPRPIKTDTATKISKQNSHRQHPWQHDITKVSPQTPKYKGEEWLLRAKRPLWYQHLCGMKPPALHTPENRGPQNWQQKCTKHHMSQVDWRQEPILGGVWTLPYSEQVQEVRGEVWKCWKICPFLDKCLHWGEVAGRKIPPGQGRGEGHREKEILVGGRSYQEAALRMTLRKKVERAQAQETRMTTSTEPFPLNIQEN